MWYERDGVKSRCEVQDVARLTCLRCSRARLLPPFRSRTQRQPWRRKMRTCTHNSQARPSEVIFDKRPPILPRHRTSIPQRCRSSPARSRTSSSSCVCSTPTYVNPCRTGHHEANMECDGGNGHRDGGCVERGRRNEEYGIVC